MLKVPFSIEESETYKNRRYLENGGSVPRKRRSGTLKTAFGTLKTAVRYLENGGGLNVQKQASSPLENGVWYLENGALAARFSGHAAGLGDVEIVGSVDHPAVNVARRHPILERVFEALTEFLQGCRAAP